MKCRPMSVSSRSILGAEAVVVQGAATGAVPLGGRRHRPFGLPCAARDGRGLAELASLRQLRALIRPPLRCSAVPQRPPKGTAPVAVVSAVAHPLPSSLSPWERAGVRADGINTTTSARYAARCGRPLCAAEERSVSRIRARSCLSEASSARPRETRAPQGSPKGRHSGADRAAPRTGRPPNETRKEPKKC